MIQKQQRWNNRRLINDVNSTRVTDSLSLFLFLKSKKRNGNIIICENCDCSTDASL